MDQSRGGGGMGCLGSSGGDCLSLIFSPASFILLSSSGRGALMTNGDFHSWQERAESFPSLLWLAKGSEKWPPRGKTRTNPRRPRMKYSWGLRTRRGRERSTLNRYGERKNTFVLKNISFHGSAISLFSNPDSKGRVWRFLSSFGRVHVYSLLPPWWWEQQERQNAGDGLTPKGALCAFV